MDRMDDEYLWDRTGQPDEEVARLEALLAQYAAPAANEWPPLALPTVHPSTESGVPWRTWLATAAVLLISFGIAWLTPRPELPADPWRVARVEGMPTIAAAPLARHSRVVPGRWLETDARSSAVVFVGRIGRLEVDPDSRLRLLTATAGEHRAELVSGTIHAQIWAPPGQFVIDTPSATAIDLGCAYTLTMDEHGVGLITVEGGWVGFEHNGREAFIPAGATGRTYPGRGPGTPTYTEASAALRAAIDTIDQADGAAAQAAPLVRPSQRTGPSGSRSKMRPRCRAFANHPRARAYCGSSALTVSTAARAAALTSGPPARSAACCFAAPSAFAVTCGSSSSAVSGPFGVLVPITTR